MKRIWAWVKGLYAKYKAWNDKQPTYTPEDTAW